MRQKSCIESPKIFGISKYFLGCQNDFGQSRWHGHLLVLCWRTFPPQIFQQKINLSTLEGRGVETWGWSLGLKYPATKFQPFQILTFSHDSNTEPIAVQIKTVGHTEHHDSAISIAHFPGYCSNHTYFKIIIQGLVLKLVSNVKTKVEIFMNFVAFSEYMNLKNCVLLRRERM